MKYKTKPYNHQQICLAQFGGREYYALLAEMGTGKTWIIINDVAGVVIITALVIILFFVSRAVIRHSKNGGGKLKEKEEGEVSSIEEKELKWDNPLFLMSKNNVLLTGQ